MPSNLGGGSHGHLGLVMNATRYAEVSTTPYVRLTHPGILNIPSGTEQFMWEELRDSHKESITLFREQDNVDKTFKKKIIVVVPDFYIKKFVNSTTHTITVPLYEVLENLKTNQSTVQLQSIIVGHVVPAIANQRNVKRRS